VTADRVFFAAGSVGTSKLLVKLKATGALPNLNGEVGKGWGDNGNVMVRPGQPHVGPDRQRCSRPCPAPASTTGPRAARSPRSRRCRPGSSCGSFYLSITKNPNRAQFSWNAATGKVDLNWQTAWKQPSIDAAKTIFDKINAKEGTIYRTDLFGVYKIWGDHLTYHPLGGARAEQGHRQLRPAAGYPGLYVIDGSLIPGNTSVNPFVTITALAERNIEKIIATDL
jgi:cholesterol oxidase